MKNSKVDQEMDAEVDKLTNGRTGDGGTDQYSDGSREGTSKDGDDTKTSGRMDQKMDGSFFLDQEDVAQEVDG